MNALQTKIAASRAANPAGFKPGNPAARAQPPYYNVWNCPIGRLQKTPGGPVAVAAECVADDLPF